MSIDYFIARLLYLANEQWSSFPSGNVQSKMAVSQAIDWTNASHWLNIEWSLLEHFCQNSQFQSIDRLATKPSNFRGYWNVNSIVLHTG